jgi:hypothetical protein
MIPLTVSQSIFKGLPHYDTMRPFELGSHACWHCQIICRTKIMSRILTDAEIQQLLTEPKPLEPRWESRLRLIPKAQEAFSQRDISIHLSNGHEFILLLRSNRISPLDFSVILVFRDTDGSEYILRRHNGAR